MKICHLVCSALVWGAVLLVPRMGLADGKTPKPGDAELPQPLDLNQVQPLLESSPFTRAINLSESIALTGLAYVQGSPVATLTDKRTKENILVSKEPNSRGWTLAEATPGSNLRLTSVKIMVGPEIVTIHYGNAQIAPTQQVKYPTDAEAIRNDENGKPYVRGSAYLSDADRERYYRGFSREAHEKFRDLIRDNREMMFKATPEERAAYSKKIFDQVDAEDKAKGQSRR